MFMFMCQGLVCNLCVLSLPAVIQLSIVMFRALCLCDSVIHCDVPCTLVFVIQLSIVMFDALCLCDSVVHCDVSCTLVFVIQLSIVMFRALSSL